jgi:hypothetical protein
VCVCMCVSERERDISVWVFCAYFSQLEKSVIFPEISLLREIYIYIFFQDVSFLDEQCAKYGHVELDIYVGYRSFALSSTVTRPDRGSPLYFALETIYNLYKSRNFLKYVC